MPAFIFIAFSPASIPFLNLKCMDETAQIQQHILQRTFDGVRSELGDDLCVICLDHISEKALAFPCKHESFDFLCLISWLQQKTTCPLCKATVKSVQYDTNSPAGAKTFTPSVSATTSTQQPNSLSRRPYPRPASIARRRGYSRARFSAQDSSEDDALARRRHVYRHNLMSMHVGSNRISQYRDFTPSMISQDETFISRARKWIRRELQVFDFLGPDASGPAGDNTTTTISSTGNSDRHLQRRKSSNAEFLLEYIIAVIKTVDLKGSSGQAEELLQEFLGRDNARIFLHELEAWLRSPYDRLEDWDRHVQYDENEKDGRATSRRKVWRQNRPSISQPRPRDSRGWDSWRPPPPPPPPPLPHHHRNERAAPEPSRRAEERVLRQVYDAG